MRDEGRKIKRGMIIHRPSSIVFLPGKGQTILEYTIVLGVIAAIMFAMLPMLKRGTQSLIKLAADQVGVQQNAEQFGFLVNDTQELGHLDSSYTATRGSMDKQTQDFIGSISYVFDDSTTTRTNALINLGFTEEQ